MPSLVLVAMAIVLIGVGGAVANTVLLSRLQREVDPELQGRIFGLLGSAGSGVRPVGLAITAPLIGWIWPRFAFAACGMSITVVAAITRPDHRRRKSFAIADGRGETDGPKTARGDAPS
jgi:MFS family permease